MLGAQRAKKFISRQLAKKQKQKLKWNKNGMQVDTKIEGNLGQSETPWQSETIHFSSLTSLIQQLKNC